MKEWYRNEFISQEFSLAHRVLEEELPFYEAIAKGDLEYVEENIREQEFVNPEGMGKLSENPVQNIRYHFVVTMALITRYIIHAGMEQEKAYRLSDFYILKMDGLSTIEEIGALHDEMCLDICKQMIRIKKLHVLSKQVVLSLDYIYSHIHNRITIKELSGYLGLSESYFSKLFSREMGIPVSEYIMRLKIEKAKNLLQYSDTDIVGIANYLAFSSQSHFICVFKKYEGITPHKFRERHFRTNWGLG
ncbi:MAG: helix-turn-helix transcriptional regulator [Lachnospiraceae bacterium]|nr:helix-turn-helix transcriptional regulator [Lachnospiraceae bacterium]MCI7558308.1 AraC family transcriptional regulator [Lachnospiraceae bacterium]MDD7548684.1 AraC family transcriptional regulator [Lachnospiraceae bacterium]